MLWPKSCLGQAQECQSRKHNLVGAGDGGMTLVEVLIALSILGVVAVTFLCALSSSLKTTMLVEEHTVAESLVRSQLEAIKDAHYSVDIPPYYTKVGIPDELQAAGYDSTITIALLDPNNDGSGDDDGLQEITVAVYHGDKEIFQAKTLKAFK